MVSLAHLWLPIFLAAVIVFVASSILHMVLPYHKSDYKKLPDEDSTRSTLRGQNLRPGLYHFPFCTHKEMKTPEAQAKFKEGPVGFVTIFPSGPPNMGKFLGMWFVYCVVVGFFTALAVMHSIRSGATYRHVFHVVGLTAFLGYGVGPLVNGIWKGQPWGMTLKEAFDGLVYAALTAGTFGWLWPR